MKKICFEIASPAKSKNNRSQHKLHLLPLVEKYHKQAEDLLEFQSKWFDCPIKKYQQWREQELIKLLRTAKKSIRTQLTKKKILKRILRIHVNILCKQIRNLMTYLKSAIQEFIIFVIYPPKRN